MLFVNPKMYFFYAMEAFNDFMISL